VQMPFIKEISVSFSHKLIALLIYRIIVYSFNFVKRFLAAISQFILFTDEIINFMPRQLNQSPYIYFSTPSSLIIISSAFILSH